MQDDHVFGFHAVRHLLTENAQAGREVIGRVLLQQGRDDARLTEIRDAAARAGIEVAVVPRAELDRRVRGRHQGVVAVLVAGPEANTLDLPQVLEAARVAGRVPLLLVLDGVQDPHNLGACLRSANAAGVDAVIVPRDRAAGLSPTVRKVACGAAEATPLVTVTNLARALRELAQAGLQLVGTDDSAQSSIYEVDLTLPTALVMGGEARGMRRLTREACDRLACLPMKGVVESLNVSVAAGVCIYEAVRQRRT